MSFATIAQSAQDEALAARITAATVQEAWNNAAVGGSAFANDVKLSAANGRLMVYPVSVASDVEQAYASALAASNPNPGGDESVITDAMILGNVQSKWPQDITP